MASKSGASGHSGKTMDPSEKARVRPANEARTKRNKARRAAKYLARINKSREKRGLDPLN